MADEVTMIGCKPSADSAEYDLYIKDIVDDWEIFRRDKNVGVYSELLSPTVPLWGNNVVGISGATVDGYYRLRLIYR